MTRKNEWQIGADHVHAEDCSKTHYGPINDGEDSYYYECIPQAVFDENARGFAELQEWGVEVLEDFMDQATGITRVREVVAEQRGVKV